MFRYPEKHVGFVLSQREKGRLHRLFFKFFKRGGIALIDFFQGFFKNLLPLVILCRMQLYPQCVAFCVLSQWPEKENKVWRLLGRCQKVKMGRKKKV